MDHMGNIDHIFKRIISQRMKPQQWIKWYNHSIAGIFIGFVNAFSTKEGLLSQQRPQPF